MKKQSVYIALAVLLLLSACSAGNQSRIEAGSTSDAANPPASAILEARTQASPHTSIGGHPEPRQLGRSTDTLSSSFDDKDEKLAFLIEYLVMKSDVLDAEYHIFFQDNSGGLVPGPSDWDIRVAIKVDLEDVPLWTDGFMRLMHHQLDISMWDDLKSERFTWNEPESAPNWKRPGSNSYLAIIPESGVILIRVSTTYILS